MPPPARIPLTTTPHLRDLFGRLIDRGHMLAVLQRELPPLADGDLHVTSCKAKPSKSRASIRAGRLHVVYTADIEDTAGSREIVLLGVAPASSEFLAQVRGLDHQLRDHPWAAPFRRLTAHVEELELALLLFPLDPALPGLAEVTGREAARHLAPCLPECRAGAVLQSTSSELVHYKPFDRAVLKVRATLTDERGGPRHRTVYAKLFAGDAADDFRQLEALWAATRDAVDLRMPEPLGYAARQRMLVLAEAPGQRDLTEWIKVLERDQPLPEGVDPERLERCAVLLARGLGELQRADVRPDLRRTFQFELARLQRDGELLLGGLAARRPELAARARALLERLDALAPTRERLVPAHGCFRHKQIVGDEHALTLIDWDGLSLANPALDAATFLARLVREPRRRPGCAPELERMGAAFRRAFLEPQPELARDLDLYEGLILTEQVLRALRRPGEDEATAREIETLATVAEAMLARVAGPS